MRQSERLKDDRSTVSAWRNWALLGWVLLVLCLFTQSMLKARPALLQAARSVLGFH